MNRIIFLDIDGVLNVCYQERDEYGRLFHPEFVDNLKRIIDATGAKIVCSSSWRKSGLRIIQEMWVKRGLPGEVIDVTPSLYLKKGVIFYNDYLEQEPTPKTFNYSIPRGCEIDYWLRYLSKENVTAHCIIDDDKDFLYNQRNHFVQCSGNELSNGSIDVECFGLTYDRANMAIEILNR